MADAATPRDGEPAAVERRLATILAADVAGYSRMMGEDEEATVQTLRGHREVFDGLLRQHRGRVFNTAGDMILAEFPSAVEAVRCATEIQTALQTRNAHLPAGRKMLFRMGINLGDVVVQGGDLLGDGVNVAARIQTIAEPGGICISGSVYDQIQNKLSLQMRQLGEQTFKNIGQPIRTFSITDGESGPLPSKSRGASGKGAWVAGGVAAAIVAIAVGGYWLYTENEARRQEQVKLAAQLATEKKAAEDAKRLADEQTRRASEAEARAVQERETAKREATLQAQAQATDEARRRVEAERRRLDEDKQRLEAEKQANAAAAAAKAQAPVAGKRMRMADAGNSAPDAPKPVVAAASGGTPVSGTYAGNVCNFPDDPVKRICWNAPLKVENGVATGTWTRKLIGKSTNLQGTIGRDGTVKVAIDGWNAKGDAPLTGAMDGHAADNRIDATGRWANGVRMEGHWARAQ